MNYKQIKTVDLVKMYFKIRYELRVREQLGDFDEYKKNKAKP